MLNEKWTRLKNILKTAPVCIHLQFHEGFSRFPTFQSRLAGYLGTDMEGFLKVLPTILKATVELRNDELSSLNLKFNPTVKPGYEEQHLNKTRWSMFDD